MEIKEGKTIQSRHREVQGSLIKCRRWFNCSHEMGRFHYAHVIFLNWASVKNITNYLENHPDDNARFK